MLGKSDNKDNEQYTPVTITILISIDLKMILSWQKF